jgi:hypothetical protein
MAKKIDSFGRMSEQAVAGCKAVNSIFLPKL